MYILLNTFRQMHLRYRNYYLRDILLWTFKQYLDFCVSAIFGSPFGQVKLHGNKFVQPSNTLIALIRLLHLYI